MSRVLISTLALGAVSILSSTPAHSQPLNINPFPANKAATLSVQQPQVMTPEPVEVFAKEAEEEIQRLQAEKEALKAEQKRVEQDKQDAEEKARALAEEKERIGAIERENAVIAAQAAEELAAERARAARIQQEAEDKALKLAEEQERLGAIERENAAIVAAQRDQELAAARARADAIEAQAKAEAEQLKREKDALALALAERAEQDAIEDQQRADEVLRLQLENEALADQLAAREEMQAAIEAEQLADAERARIEQQQAAEVAALEQENVALAKKLKAIEEQEEWNAQKVELETILEPNPEVISLQEKNRELAGELRVIQEEKRKQAEIDMAMRALDVQKRADMDAENAYEGAYESAVQGDAIEAVQVTKVVGVDPLFESASIADNPVGMTPMVIEPSPLKPSDVIEVSASDLGLVEPQVKILGEPDLTQDIAQVAVQAEPQAAPIIATRSIDLETAKIQVLPYEGQKAAQVNETFQEYAPVRASYRSANAGESLEDVLRSWSQSEGVGFLWKTTQRFDVLAPVNVDGDYAQSVQALLDQYSGGDVRPVGKLQMDPVTGTRTLSILTE